MSSLFRTTKNTDTEVLKILNDGSEVAVQYAKNYNQKLDYSSDSLKKVDKILDKLNKEYFTQHNKDELKNVALIFGLYIIAVFEQNQEKEYLQRKLIAMEDDNFPYCFKGKLIFPCIWV